LRLRPGDRPPGGGRPRLAGRRRPPGRRPESRRVRHRSRRVRVGVADPELLHAGGRDRLPDLLQHRARAGIHDGLLRSPRPHPARPRRGGRRGPVAAPPRRVPRPRTGRAPAVRGRRRRASCRPRRSRVRMTAVAADQMPDLLTLYASSQPGKPAVVDDRPGAGVVTWTYAQLEAEANRLANALASLGVAPGDKVIWCGPNSPRVVAVVNATRKLGAGAVPLNYRLTAEEARYIVTHSDASAAYVDAEYAHLIPAPEGYLRHVLVHGG